MKCPIDQTEMEKGITSGSIWRKWDRRGFGIKLMKVMNDGELVTAYKCPKCGKVELKVEENK